ncbi:Zinc finger protein 583, partial [Acanthisitta chloris]
CCDCGKGFDGNSDLTQPQLGHTKEKPDLCAPCKKSWSQDSSLTQHQ